MAQVGVTHDVMVAGHYLRLMPRGYRRRAAPVRGARISSGDYGYGDLSIWQRWHQFCWNGGMAADKWVDDAMYYYGVGLDTTITERLVLSPDLRVSVNTNLRPNDLGHARRYFTWRTKGANERRLYSYSIMPDNDGSTLYKYQDWNDTWVVEQHWGDGKKATCHATFKNEVVIGFSDGVMKHSPTPNNNSNWTNVQAPSSAGSRGITAMMKYSQRLYVAYEDRVYRYKLNKAGDKWIVDGNTVFYDAEGSSPIRSMEVHLGFLYMGSEDGHIHRTDSNNTFDIWSWDGGTSIISLRSFDGRLFVGTYEYNDDRTVGHQGIYQFTGSAVTQLKKWGQGDKASIMGQFTEYDRKLFYGAAGLWGLNVDANGVDQGGFGVACFDPIEDAHSIWSTNKDAVTYPDSSGTGRDWVVDDVIFWRGYLHASVRGFGNFRTKVRYRGTRDEEGDFDIGGPNSGYLISSNYDAGTPGLEKLWRDAVVTATIPENTSVTLHVSVDRGDTWSEVGTLVGDPAVPERREALGLSDIRSHQLMYRLTLNSTDATKSPVVTGVTFAYLPIAEPNWVWDLTLQLSNRVKLLDGSSEVVDVASIREDLANHFRAQDVVDFLDVDGADWSNAVIIWDFVDDAFIPANAVDPQEVSIRVTLLECQKADEAP